MNKSIGGPYFKGQEPCHCGHYYPDVLRTKDMLGQNDTVVREFDCCICKKTYTIQIPGVLRHSLKDPKPMTQTELQARRMSERRRLMSK